MSPTIEIIVSPNGNTTVQTKGFVGTACQDASRFVELALGKRIGESLTGEYHQAQVEPKLDEKTG